MAKIDPSNGRTSGFDDATLVHELFESRAFLSPSAIALQLERSAAMTYAELSARSTDLAAQLQERGVGPDTMVPIMFDISFEMIISILAVLKSGGAYVPLALDHPYARLKKKLEALTATFLLMGQTPSISEKMSELKKGFPSLEILTYSLSSAGPVGMSSSLAPSSVTADNLAYVLFTSGSTGAPKGVAVEHRNLLAFLRSGKGNARGTSTMRKLLLSPYTFDISVGDIFSTLTTGGTLGLVRRDELLSNLPYWLEIMETTDLAVTPSIGRQLPTHGLPQLRRILFVGETLPVALAVRLRQTREVYNTMGPTECVVDATEYSLPVPTQDSLVFRDRVPIGYPIGETTIHILCPSTLELVVGQEVGEICIGGPQVARGYLADAELSKKKFVSDPFSPVPLGRMFRTGDLGRWNQFGQVEHLGRIDSQVKLRAIRIEPGEVEHVVQSVNGIETAYADVIDMGRLGEQSLVVAYTLQRPHSGDEIHIPSRLITYTFPYF